MTFSHPQYNFILSRALSPDHAELISSQREGRVSRALSNNSSCMFDGVTSIPSPNPYLFGLKHYPCSFGENTNPATLTVQEKNKYMAYQGNLFDVYGYISDLDQEGEVERLSSIEKLNLYMDLYEAMDSRLTDLRSIESESNVLKRIMDSTEIALASHAAFYDEIKARHDSGRLNRDANYLISLSRVSYQDAENRPFLIDSLFQK